ncbi:MAG: MmgE/PrpD family protein [Chloroflexi bacterium]|nr:MAG: MmgE/PrpD family protein [Chloroflexota bacterium]
MATGEGTAAEPISRRTFLKGSAALTGLGVAAQVAARTTSALGAPVAVPAAARTVEGGLAAFAGKWTGAGPVIALTRFARFLTNRVFNCRVAGQPRSYVLNLGVAGATLTPGVDPYAHADLVLEERDWLGVLFGDYTGLAPVLAGRSFPSRDSANSTVLLGIVMFIFAHVPAGAHPDPELLVRIIAGAVGQGGIPHCTGEPAELQVLDDLLADPRGQAREAVTPDARAVDVTRVLAEWMAGLRYQDIPPGAIANAKDQLVSILGATYAGSVMTPGRKLAAAVRGWDEGGPCTVIGKARYRTTARNAAMVNSFLAQILEWEDWTFLAHSGASIIPVALAVGEQARVSGRQLLTAIVGANEILARAGEVLTDAVNTGNALAVHQIETTLIAGKLFGLRADQLQDALGIACAQPQLTSINAWTAEAKGMLTAWPAATGVTAALLARAGITGSRTALENPLGYSYRVADIATPRELERMVRDLGHVWRFDAARHELFTKRYPTDGFQLTSVDAVVRLRRGPLAGIRREQLPGLIARIEMRIPLVMASSATMFSGGLGGTRALLERVADPRHPDWTYIALLFDGTWPVAAALADGELTYRQYREDRLRDPVIRALTDRVEEIPDLTMGVFAATARVELRDGRSFEQHVPCIGSFPVREKLDVGASEVESPARIEQILAAVSALESFDDVRDFTAILNPGGAGSNGSRTSLAALPTTNAGGSGAGPMAAAGAASAVVLGHQWRVRRRGRPANREPDAHPPLPPS